MDPSNLIYRCEDLQVVEAGTPTLSALMFSAGVLGNVVALILLEVRRRRTQKASLFHVLVSALVITDLLGTFSVSPLVITSYAQNLSMIALSSNRTVCKHFAFSMTFFSLVTLAILLLMAGERCLSIAHPFFYERRVSRRCGSVSVALVYAACALFCLAPLLDVGEFIQYCPGTFCFIRLINPRSTPDKVYNYVYVSSLLLMIVFTVLCNASVIYHLLLMFRRAKAQRGSFYRQRGQHRPLSITEEVEHLVLLGFMTITFVICSLPIVIYAYNGSSLEYSRAVLLLLSMNPIIDPWVFIILSPPVPRLLWAKLCKTPGSQRQKSKHKRSEPLQPSPPIELQR